MNQGGKLQNDNTFDPYKSSLSSTNYQKQKVPALQDAGNLDSYDPAAVQSEIEKIQQQREKALLATKIQDRDIKVFQISTSGTSNLKNYLMELDSIEQERLKALKLSEEKYEEAINNAHVLKVLAENEKNSKFRNKRQEELERIVKQPVYTTALVRIRFPDDYVIQGTFGALERLDKVYKFVKENLFFQDREFYLYETPPKKVLKDQTENMKALRLVPSSMLYFGWSDLDQTMSSDGPFLHMEKLREKIVQM
ncbi:hypothetical protein FGO68_gene15520 [Halteria grandinella]|uniref:UBX domain-containing protein n=1 Tax=Halteria grandinella TaxID=5974 RepID=A0A8J8SW31_HALGN|nr:hypothetical protein FGO68_gene15520 [Halteria grandinella]